MYFNDPTPEFNLFKTNYSKYVTNMDSREFATLIIKYGGDKTMIIIIKEMIDKQYTIPRLLLNNINSICAYDTDYILDEFYKSKNIYNKQEMKMCNFEELYSEFKYFIKKNFPEEKIISKIILKNYFEIIEEKNKKINKLSDLDCELMKLSHIKN
jgi:hypothetical protein